MRPIGRYQMSVRKLLFLPALVAFSWWLAIQAVEWGLLREDYRERSALHAKEALSCQAFADSPIRDTVGSYVLRAPDRRCIWQESPLTEADRREERRNRERARRLAAHHRTLGRKYAWAAWFPFLPVAPDPPQPGWEAR